MLESGEHRGKRRCAYVEELFSAIFLVANNYFRHLKYYLQGFRIESPTLQAFVRVKNTFIRFFQKSFDSIQRLHDNRRLRREYSGVSGVFTFFVQQKLSVPHAARQNIGN